MINNADLIDVIRCNNKKYNLKNLASYYNASEEEIVSALLEIIETKATKIKDLTKIDKMDYLYKIIGMLKEETEKETTKMIKSRLAVVLDSINRKPNNIKNSKVYKKVREEIKDVLDSKYNLQRQTIPVEESYEILCYIVFVLKDIDYLRKTLRNYKSNINIKNSEGKYFIEEIIDKFAISKVENTRDYIYYKEVIKTLLDSSIVVIDKGLLYRLKNRVNKYIVEINSLDINNKEEAIIDLSLLSGIINKRLVNMPTFINEHIDNLIMQDNDINRYLANKLKEIFSKTKYDSNDLILLNEMKILIDKENIEGKEKLYSLIELGIVYITSLVDKDKTMAQINHEYGIVDDKDFTAIRDASSDEIIDCTDKFVITVDGEHVNLYDDALSLDTYSDGTKLLGIYIADVASFVERGSDVDKYAYNQGQAIYIPRIKKISMLPEILSKSLALTVDNKKRVLGYFFLFNSKNECIGFKVCRCIVKVNNNFDYESLDKLFNLTTPEGNYVSLLKKLSKIITLPHSSEYRQIKSINRNKGLKVFDSESMIMDYMVYLNTFIANYFNSHKELPFIFRNNLSDFDLNKLKSVVPCTGINIDRNFLNEVSSKYQQSYYSPYNKGHVGFGLDAYTHVTTPLRNYCSLENERLVIKYMIDKDMEVPNGEMERLSKVAENVNLERSINSAYSNEIKSLVKKHI